MTGALPARFWYRIPKGEGWHGTRDEIAAAAIERLREGGPRS